MYEVVLRLYEKGEGGVQESGDGGGGEVGRG
jgi:hypothetical protein